MNQVYNKIMQSLSLQGVAFECIEHEEVFTAEQARKVCNHEEYEGTKSVVLFGKSIKAVITIPGNDRFDFKVLRDLFGEKLRMLDAERLPSEIGVDLGSVSPFGYPPEIKVAISRNLFSNEFVYFNPGVNSITIKMRGVDFEKIASADHAITF